MAQRALHGWLPGMSQNVGKHNIFEQKKHKTQKMLIIRQIDCREVGWPLRCNAFAIARFLVLLSIFQLQSFMLPFYEEYRVFEAVNFITYSTKKRETSIYATVSSPQTTLTNNLIPDM